MYTHKGPEALQALLGFWDKEVGNYQVPLHTVSTIEGFFTVLSPFGSFQTSLGPSGPHFSSKKARGSEKMNALC